jgi:hypothetical protein
MLFREMIALCSEINALGGQNVELFNVKAGGKQSDHRVSEG